MTLAVKDLGVLTALFLALMAGAAAPALAEPAQQTSEARHTSASEAVPGLLPKQVWERLIHLARPDAPPPRVADVQRIFGVSAELARALDPSTELLRSVTWPIPGGEKGSIVFDHRRGPCRYGPPAPGAPVFCSPEQPTVWVKACCIFGEGPEGKDGCPTVGEVTRQLLSWGWTRRSHDLGGFAAQSYFHPPAVDVFDRKDGSITLSPSSPVGDSDECVNVFEIQRPA